MQPFDDSLYSGYSTYNNWKVPSTPASSLAKAGFAWGLTSGSLTSGSLTSSSFNSMNSLNSNPLGSTSYGPNNSQYGSMYSAVVSASSASPTSSADNIGGSKSEPSPNLQQYPPMPKLKSSPLLKDSGGIVVDDSLNRSPEGPGSGGAGAYNPLV